jgi:hypothetical protein
MRLRRRRPTRSADPADQRRFLLRGAAAGLAAVAAARLLDQFSVQPRPDGQGWTVPTWGLALGLGGLLLIPVAVALLVWAAKALYLPEDESDRPPSKIRPQVSFPSG